MPDRRRPLNIDPEALPFLPEKKIVLIYILKVPSMSNFIWTSAEELRTSGEAAQVNRACPSMEGQESIVHSS
jgi:hypothetical protein